MAEDVEELISTYSLYEPILIGHSMGGKVAMQVASNLSEQIQKVVVEDIAPRQYDNRHGDILDALFRLSLDGVEALGELDKALAIDIPDKQLRGFLLQNLARDAGAFKWKLNLPALRQHVSAITAAPDLKDDIEVPTLFVRGECSDYIQLPQDEQLIASHFLDYDIVTVPRAGHWVHAFSAQDFAKAVDDFLEK
jgi:esterase